MTDYKIEINEILKKDFEDDKETGIWAKITNLKTCETIEKRIWWKDREGITHDDKTELPVNLRDLVDNAWIEHSRKFR